MTLTYTIEQITAVAAQILSQTQHKVIVFNGQMGAGKTTLIKAICEKLGVNDGISSPTFSLVNEYITFDNQLIYHFDFYRIKIETEAMDMGADDYFYSNNYCFIEWAEKIPNLIPENHSKIDISILENGQRVLVLT